MQNTFKKINNFKLAYQYSENEKELKKRLRELKFYYKILYPELKENGYYKLPIDIKIVKSDFIMEYTFNESHNTALDYKNSLWNNSRFTIHDSIGYNILCDISLNLCSPENFNDFCDEFGYNNDSIKDKELFELVLEHKHKLLCLFNESDTEFLPRLTK